MSVADRPKQDFVLKAIDEEKMTRVPHMEKITNSLTELNTEGAIVHRGELLSFFERKKEKYKQRKASTDKQTENKKLVIVKIDTPNEVNKGDIEKNSIPEEMSATQMKADVPIVCTSLSEEEVQDKPPKEIHLKAGKPVAEAMMTRPDSKDQSAVHTRIQQSSRDEEVDLSNTEMSIAKNKSYKENIYSDKEEKALSTEKISSKIKDVNIAKIVSPEEQPDTIEKVDANGDVVDIFKNSSSLFPPNVEKLQENVSKDVHVKVEDLEVNAMEVKLDSKGASSENPLIHKDQEIAHSHIHQSSREDTLTKIKRTNQLIDMFPHFSPEILVDMLREFGTLEDTVEELLKLSAAEEFLRNDVDEVFLVKEPADDAEDLLQKNDDEVAFVKERVVKAEDFLHNHEDEANDEVTFVKERVAKSLLLLNEEEMFKKVTLIEKRDFNPDDPLENKFRLAKGQYMSVSREFARSIESIDYVENRILMETFERKKCQLKWEGKDTKEYFLFHGTKNVNIESILRENFRMDLAGKNGQAHGRGIYFSEKTAIPDMYTDRSKKTLLLCRVLLGREFTGEDKDIPQGFDSKSVEPDQDKRANIIIIKEVDQILPCFVLNLAGSEYDSLTNARPLQYSSPILTRVGRIQPFFATPPPQMLRGSSLKPVQTTSNQFSPALNTLSPVAMNGVSHPQDCMVVITNLQTSVTQEDIKEVFGGIGALRRAVLVTPGHAEVIFVQRKEAERAVEVYHNRQLDGKPMKCTLVGQGTATGQDTSTFRWWASWRRHQAVLSGGTATQLVGQDATTPSNDNASKQPRPLDVFSRIGPCAATAPVFRGAEFKLPQALMRRGPLKNATVTAPDTESVHRALFTDKKNVGNKPQFTITIPKKDKDEPKDSRKSPE